MVVVPRAIAKDVNASGHDRICAIIGARAPRRFRDVGVVRKKTEGWRETEYMVMNSPPPERLRERRRSLRARLARLLALSLTYNRSCHRDLQ